MSELILPADETISIPVPADDSAYASPASTAPVDVFADIDSHDPGTIWISNVLKPLTKLDKPDNYCVEVILVKSVNTTDRIATVYHHDTKQVSKAIVTTESVGDRLADGSIVMQISGGNEKRLYGTIRLTLDDLMEKFGDRIDGVKWEPRHKKRRPKNADGTAEVGYYVRRPSAGR